MRRYLLDTSVLAAYILGRAGAVSGIEPWIVREEAATSMLVYGEVIEYISGSTSFITRRAELRRLLQQVFPYNLTQPILERYAMIRRQLRPPHGGGLIGDVDTLIAATAIEKNLTLVTTDSDFARVPALSLRLVTRQHLRT